ncbi:MAG: hypothetical protein O9322_05515 [Beijerinckiaceae bacterium]|nr:hypothetical protein [Beijerinckiaceae bacterium]MCZ8298980.1 hypothetical protein [Beijerinckiaceae bacterium]
MRLVEVLPLLTGIGLVAALFTISIRNEGFGRSAWVVPAALSALFLGWSVTAAVVEGPLGFWAEHTRNLWGNQIWFDLLLAVVVGWFLIVPRARAMKMNVLPWMALVVATGSIGFLAMASRLLYLENSPNS